MFQNTRGVSRRGFLAGTAAVMGAAGCSSSDDNDGGSSGGDGEDASVAGVLNVWATLPEELGWDALAEAFGEKYPNVELVYNRYIYSAEENLKLDTALQGGVPIDVFTSLGASDVERRSQAGLALDLTDLAAEDPDTSIFTEADPISLRFDDRLYSIPMTWYPNFVILNQDMLDAAGIDVPWDWDVTDFRAIANELREASGATAGALQAPELAAMALGGDNFYNDAGDASNFGAPEHREGFELILAMDQEKSSITQGQISAEKIETYVQNYFINEDFGYFINGSTFLRFIADLDNYPHDFRTTFRPLPAPVKGEPYWNNGVLGDDMQISANTEYPEAAWAFMKFWLTEGAQYVAKSGKISTLSKYKPEIVAPEPLIEAMLGEDREAIFDVESFQKVFYSDTPEIAVRTKTAALSEVTGIRNELVGQLRLGQIGLDEMIDQLTSRADAAIAKAS